MQKNKTNKKSSTKTGKSDFKGFNVREHYDEIIEFCTFFVFSMIISKASFIQRRKKWLWIRETGCYCKCYGYSLNIET